MSLNLLEILKRLKEQCKLFDNFSNDDLGKLLKMAEIEKYDKENSVIFQQGDPGDTLYLILSGEVEVFYHRETKGKSIINILKPGEIFGEMSLITREIRSANVKILKPPVIVLAISEKNLEKDRKIEAMIFGNFARILAVRLKEKNKEVHLLKQKEV